MDEVENIAITKEEFPPRSDRFQGLQIFTERRVIMRGLDYFMRVYIDGSVEFIRYDKPSGRWFYLCFPPEKQLSA